MALETNLIKFTETPLSQDLFDEIAHKTAICIANSGGWNKNKSTQLRKYYDELLMWEQKINQDKSKYADYLPLIKMINAKVAYAKGRDLVTQEFVDLMRHCLKELTNKPESFRTCKLFFESFMGFYKYEEELRKEQQTKAKRH
jgi:CRISPR-associated protein Csm2